MARLALLLLTLLSGYVLAGVAASAAGAAPSPVVTLNGPVAPRALDGHIDTYLDLDWSKSLEEMALPESAPFSRWDGYVPDYGYTPGRVWIRVRMINATEDTTRWRAFFRENFKQHFDVFVVRENGAIERVLHQSLEVGFDARPIAFPELVAPMVIQPGETVQMIVRLWSQGSSEVPLSIETDESFASIAAGRMAKNFTFYGMTMLLIIVALLSFAIFRHRVFAAYIAYASSTLLFIVHADGVAYQYLWPGLPRFNAYASVVTGSGFIIFGAIYARVFLRTSRFHPIVDKVLVGIILGTLGIVVATFFYDNQPLKKLLVLVALCAIITYTAAGLIAARTRFKEVRFFVLAWAGAMLSALIMTSRHWFGVEISQDLQYDSMRAVMVLDAFMMGLAIADRYNQMRTSRQNALSANLETAERNLHLNSRLHELEQRFEQATQLARMRGEELENTVHDLRQPLHALRLNVRDIMESDTASSESSNKLEAAFVYLENLVSGHLQQPAAGSGGPDRLRVPEVLDGIHEMFEPDAREKGLRFRYVPTALDADVDPLVLMRIVNNLVANAIKYTDRGGVLLGARRKGNRLSIEVHDSGPGMDAAEFATAQKRAARLDGKGPAREGEGFGLAIATDLAAKNGMVLRRDPRRRSGLGIALEIPMKHPVLTTEASPTSAPVERADLVYG